MATLQETFSQAIRLHKAGEWQPAEQLYRQVLDLDPNHVLALSNLGALAYQADKPEEAIEPLRRALSLRPEVAELHLNLAAALQATHDIPAAIAEYRAALRLQPTAAHFHVSLGQALLHLGARDDALTLGLEPQRLEPERQG